MKSQISVGDYVSLSIHSIHTAVQETNRLNLVTGVSSAMVSSKQNKEQVTTITTGAGVYSVVESAIVLSSKFFNGKSVWVIGQ